MKKCPRCAGQDFWVFPSGQKRCKRCGLTRKKEKTYWKATRISAYWKGQLLEFFCLGVPAYRLRFQVPLNLKKHRAMVQDHERIYLPVSDSRTGGSLWNA